MRHRFLNDSSDCNGEDMTNVIDHATKEAKPFLHRTQDPANPHKHRTIVCIICDCFIIGTETIHKLTKEDIGAHSGRLGVKSYEEYYQTALKVKVKKQYQVQGLQDMLLSPRSRNILMITPSVLSVTPECNHRWHPRELLQNLPLQTDS